MKVSENLVAKCLALLANAFLYILNKSVFERIVLVFFVLVILILQARCLGINLFVPPMENKFGINFIAHNSSFFDNFFLSGLKVVMPVILIFCEFYTWFLVFRVHRMV